MKLEMEHDFHSEVKLEMEYDFHSEVKLEMETELDLPIKSEVILKEEQEYHQPDCGPTPILFPGIKEELYFEEDMPDDQGMCPFPKQGQIESGAGPHFLFTVKGNTRFSSNPGHLQLSPHLYQQSHQQPLQQMVQQHKRDPIQAGSPGPQPDTLKQALKHLLQSLRYPITHEQQKLIVQLVKSDPRLVAAIIKQKLLYQNQPKLLVSTYGNSSNPCFQQNSQPIHQLLQQDPSQQEVQFNQQSSILSQPSEVLGLQDNIERHALQHLLWALKSTKKPEQIKLILQIVKRDPKLMAAFIKHWLENKRKQLVVQMTHQPHRQPLHQGVQITQQLHRQPPQQAVQVTQQLHQQNLHQEVQMTQQLHQQSLHQEVQMTQQLHQQSLHQEVQMTQQLHQQSLHQEVQITQQLNQQPLYQEVQMTQELHQQPPQQEVQITQQLHQQPPQQEVQITQQLHQQPQQQEVQIIQQLHRQPPQQEVQITQQLHRQPQQQEVQIIQQLHPQPPQQEVQIIQQLHRQPPQQEVQITQQLHQQLPQQEVQITQQLHRQPQQQEVQIIQQLHPQPPQQEVQITQQLHRQLPQQGLQMIQQPEMGTTLDQSCEGLKTQGYPQEHFLQNLLHNLRSPNIPEPQQQLLQKLKTNSKNMASFIKQKQMNLNKQELRFSKSGKIDRYSPNSGILQNYPDLLHPSMQILQQQPPQQPVMGPVKPQPAQSQDVQRQALQQMSQEPGMGPMKPQDLQKQALQQLLQALSGPNTPEQQALVLQIVKRHPKLMAAIIKRKLFNQKQQKQRISKCENTNK